MSFVFAERWRARVVDVSNEPELGKRVPSDSGQMNPRTLGASEGGRDECIQRSSEVGRECREVRRSVLLPHEVA